MVCAKCGTLVGVAAGKCAVCGTPIRLPRAPAFVGVLTPPPDLAPTIGTGSPGSGSSGGDAPTFAPANPEHPANPSNPPNAGASVTQLAASAGGGPPASFADGKTIAGRYHVLRLLGVGGMGAVYQAWDEKLGVAVALKVVLQQQGPGTDPRTAQALEQRFKRELLLARQVTHKNVVRIHDLGEVDGTLYISMPYVQGSNLAAILKSEGKLALDRVLRIARQVASGLAAAHEAGVVHRDLKPANIMIDADDHALIMDFGIAHSSAEGTRATHTGAIVGTLEYMAPEQAEGKPVDQRCDIYAFGLILYDLLTGGRPTSQSAIADLMARIEKPLPGIRTVNADVPELVAEIIDRCLQRDPDSRYETSADLVAALETLDDRGHLRPAAAPRRSMAFAAVIGTVAVIVGLTAGIVFRGRAGVAPPAHEPVSVLIADFENRANDPVFDESVEQALTIGMEGASFVTTVPRKEAKRLAEQIGGGKLDEAAAALISVREGVKFVVAGAIDGGSSGYTITARLIDPAVRKTIKTATTRAKSKADVLQAVGALAADVRRDLGDTTSESARLAASETFTAASLDAVREYTIAQDLSTNSRHDEAIAHYKRAIQFDPQFGRAFAGWANSAFELGRNDEAANLWKQALAMMDRMSDRERYRTLGNYYIRVARNYDQAIDSFRTLLAKYPADRPAHNNLAVAYFSKLDFAKALEEGRKAIEIYKGSFKYRNNYLLFAMYAGDFATAEKGARDLIKEDPKFSDAYFPLAISLLAKDDRAGARATYEQLAPIDESGASLAAMGLADIAMYEGRFADAQRILAEAVPADEKAKNSIGRSSKYAALAETYAALGNPARALETARKALQIARQESVALPAARVFAAAGRAADAKALAADLSKDLQPQSRAYGKIIEGEIALQQDHVNDAVEAFRAASQLMDVWLSHFDLGVAYVRAGHYAEAIAEFDTCAKRRGEATAIFLDDVPSFRYLAALPYWRGRAQEGVGMKSSALDNYKSFVALRSNTAKDPLVMDARERLSTR